MTTEINAYTRHYIFIDPNNINTDLDTHPILNKIKDFHKKHYKNHTNNIIYHGYNDIVKLLNEYDLELSELFQKINYNYPALLADIGRYIILYTYGGIYHDLKFTSTPKLDNMIKLCKPDVDIICEEHPNERFRVRVGNIVTPNKNSKFLNCVMQKIKQKLNNLKNTSKGGSKLMVNIGSNTYIDEFKNNKIKNIYKFPFINLKIIIFNGTIYKKNIKTWQTTEEPIFRL
jgi:hypothetical protein